MSKICRHFKALSRKNAILWRRNLTCGVFELILPAALMCLIVWMRTKVNIKHVDLAGLEKYKHPIYPAMKYEKAAWVWDLDWLTESLAPFMEFAGYIPVRPIKPNGDIDVSATWSSQCK